MYTGEFNSQYLSATYSYGMGYIYDKAVKAKARVIINALYRRVEIHYGKHDNYDYQLFYEDDIVMLDKGAKADAEYQEHIKEKSFPIQKVY